VALDFCLITKEGAPMEAAPVAADRHRGLIELAGRNGGSPLLMRMRDYSQDVRWSADEVVGLAEELRRLIGLDDCPEPVADTAMLMLNVCRYAEREGASIEAIAD
jgi:hypothetical protein